MVIKPPWKTCSLLSGAGKALITRLMRSAQPGNEVIGVPSGMNGMRCGGTE